MLNKAAVYFTLVAITSLVGAVGYYHTQNAILASKLSSAEMRVSIAEANVAVQKRALAQANAARAVLESHLDQAEQDAERWRKTASDLSSKEGANEALNAYERAVLDSLRRP